MWLADPLNARHFRLETTGYRRYTVDNPFIAVSSGE
jgi:hypothetical protein